MIENNKHKVFADEYMSALKKGKADNKIIPKNGYYVYIITENDKICYIGKGKKNRVLSHIKGNGNKYISKKRNIHKYDWFIVYKTLNEFEAFNYERTLLLDAKENNIELYNIIYSTRSAKEKEEYTKNILKEGLNNHLNYMFVYGVKNRLSHQEITDMFINLINPKEKLQSKVRHFKDTEGIIYEQSYLVKTT